MFPIKQAIKWNIPHFKTQKQWLKKTILDTLQKKNVLAGQLVSDIPMYSRLND